MSTSYQPLQKRILSQAQLESFQTTETHAAVINYIAALNDCVIGVKLTDDCGELSPAVLSILSILDSVDGLVAATPPVDNKASRFGNPAFRTFYDQVSESSTGWHNTIPGIAQEAIVEVEGYFKECWGNRTRIDYGSGMELNFLCWILCLERIGVLKEGDRKPIVVKVFWRYMTVMRGIQSMYWLEPAGSHGVWGLDDYHFLPFLFGSAQLIGHKYLRPKSIHDPEILDEYSKDYMYLACIKFINSIKTASLRWHSPMLDDISSVKTWDKVNSGMIKMYNAEVLGKLPVAQHFLFGSILPYQGIAPPASGDTAEDEHGHVHAQGTWGDCCGIPVPSAFGAAKQDERDKGLRTTTGTLLSGVGIRPVPFD